VAWPLSQFGHVGAISEASHLCPQTFLKYDANSFYKKIVKKFPGISWYESTFTPPYKTGTAAGVRYVQNLGISDKPAQKIGDKIHVQKPVRTSP